MIGSIDGPVIGERVFLANDGDEPRAGALVGEADSGSNVMTKGASFDSGVETLEGTALRGAELDSEGAKEGYDTTNGVDNDETDGFTDFTSEGAMLNGKSVGLLETAVDGTRL